MNVRIPIVGRDRVGRLLIGLGKQVPDLGLTIEAREIHGQPGARVYPSQTSVLAADLVMSLASMPDDARKTTTRRYRWTRS